MALVAEVGGAEAEEGRYFAAESAFKSDELRSVGRALFKIGTGLAYKLIDTHGPVVGVDDFFICLVAAHFTPDIRVTALRALVDSVNC